MDPISFVIAVPLVVWVVVRQFRGRFATGRLVAPMPLAVLLLGIVQLATVAVPWTVASVAVIAAELVVTAALGAARGASTRLSERDGYLYQQGGWLLLVLWVLSIAVRIAPLPLLSGPAAAATSATLTFALGVSLVAQNTVLAARVRANGRPLHPGGADRRGAASGSRLGG